jgi:hypothetical protein
MPTSGVLACAVVLRPSSALNAGDDWAPVSGVTVIGLMFAPAASLGANARAT